MIKAIFTFFQMQVESFTRHAIELMQASFGIRPETFYSVNVNVADGKDIFGMIDPQMFRISDIDKTVVAAPAVRMNHRVELQPCRE